MDDEELFALDILASGSTEAGRWWGQHTETAVGFNCATTAMPLSTTTTDCRSASRMTPRATDVALTAELRIWVVSFRCQGDGATRSTALSPTESLTSQPQHPDQDSVGDVH